MKLFLPLFFLCAFSGVLAQEKMSRRIIFIGDAGGLINGKNPVIDAVAKDVDLNDPRNTVIYLGDNIYPTGLPDTDAPGFKSADDILKYQASIGIGKKANILFIPGNHDWQQGKAEGFERIGNQQRALDSLHQPNITLWPKDGCPGPVEISMGENSTLVLFDSQWFLHPYDKPGIESDCDCKTPDEFSLRLQEIAYRNRDKLLIVAMHHPFRSYSIHGGYFTLKQHIFPFTDAISWFYLPLPVLGSAYPLARGTFGTIQDLKHPLYKRMIATVEGALAGHKHVVFASGHDHSLQFIHDKSFNYIVSASGYHENRVKKGKDASFVAPVHGYATLEIDGAGKVNTRFFTVNDSAQSKTAYDTILYTLPKPGIEKQKAQNQVMNLPDSVTVPADTQYDSVGRNFRKVMGEAYRKVWAKPVKMKVFDIDKEQGGLEITQRGGGHQTRSLRLKDKNGYEWQLRTLKKFPALALPQVIRESDAARDIVQDQISAANPYAALTVPVIAEAAGVPYSRPELVYVPDDPRLGTNQKDFAGTVCMLERREPVMPGETKSTPKMMEKLQDDNDNSVNQKKVLKARLLDILLGDWDRHEDQWRWAYKEDKKGKEYYPVPRDRDQVYFTIDGFVPKSLTAPWILPYLKGFSPKITDINKWNFSTRYFDRLFLNELDEKDWKEAADELVKTLPDPVFERAVTRFPAEVQPMVSAKTIATLKLRRDALPKAAIQYYRALALAVDVPLSDKKEQVLIERMKDGDVQVTARKISKKDKIEQKIYKRTFHPGETKEIRIYGQKGDDNIRVSGDEHSPIRIRIIGGKGQDTIGVDEGGGKKVQVYKQFTQNDSLHFSGPVRLHQGKNPAIDAYNYRAFKYEQTASFATAGYNLDDGILLGAGVNIERQGFRKVPDASKQTITLGHALATSAVFMKYKGRFNQLIGNSGLSVTSNFFLPNNTFNYFGQGNDTRFVKMGDKPIRFYRLRYDLIQTEALLDIKRSKVFNVSAGPTFQYFSLDRERNIDRFIASGVEPDDDVFRSRLYTGLRVKATVDNRNNALFPTRGVYWENTIDGVKGLTGLSHDYLQLQSAFTLYTSLNAPARVVMANRVGAGVQFGSPAFFQSLYLGGQGNLLGYRKNRFAGSRMLFHNIELRARLFDFKTYLFPGSLGLIGFHDVGRIYVQDDQSDRWHTGYGGGIYISPANLVVVTAVLGHSGEETLPYISFGFRF
ncbi:MAG: BamA/TamA family outer membrane protein [Mucilaginibacter polytrichastri]|nr:BamA/TamA family outer membrane protein [Mucilaginibacter polytrichastri]